MRLEYRSTKHIIYSNKYHIVFCPKYRRKVLTGRIEKRLKQLIKQICKEKNADLIECEIMPDHVHILVEINPLFGIHKLVRFIKGRTSRLLRQEFPELRSKLPTLWTHSYFLSTVGGAPLEIIKQYIENQKNV